jgi:hypothetical protein
MYDVFIVDSAEVPRGAVADVECEVLCGCARVQYLFLEHESAASNFRIAVQDHVLVRGGFGKHFTQLLDNPVRTRSWPDVLREAFSLLSQYCRPRVHPNFGIEAEQEIDVRFQKRAHNPMPLAAGVDNTDGPLPWPDGKRSRLVVA